MCLFYIVYFLNASSFYVFKVFILVSRENPFFFCSPALSTAVVEVFLLEFNMSPVLKDPKDSPHAHDADMIQAALDIVFPDGVVRNDHRDWHGNFGPRTPQSLKIARSFFSFLFSTRRLLSPL